MYRYLTIQGVSKEYLIETQHTTKHWLKEEYLLVQNTFCS